MKCQRMTLRTSRHRSIHITVLHHTVTHNTGGTTSAARHKMPR